MFEYDYPIYDDYGCESIHSYEPVSLNEALEAINGHEEDATIETINGTVVFEDGGWLVSREEAEKIAQAEEEAAYKAAEEKEARRAAEKATFGDDIDKANIAFIMSIAKKFPAKDNGARRTAEEVGKNEEWRDKRDSWKSTEGDVVHLPSGREYHIDMWRGVRKVTRTALCR